MLTKAQKVQFVNNYKKLLKSYKVVGVVQVNGIPDRLLQSTKSQLKENTKFIMGRKTLLIKILESNEDTKKLVDQVSNTSAIILSNEDPFELYNKFRTNSLKLAAKPGQISPEDIEIKGGETSIQPGQTVTELKSAGVDVQIQKGKVIIAKDKVLTKKGDVITGSVAKALHILEIFPFKAEMLPSSLLSEGMVFRKEVLGINTETVTSDITLCFRNALSLSLEAKLINAYTINTLLSEAYNNAMHLGIEVKAMDSGIIEHIIANAAAQATAISALAPAAESAEAPSQ